MLTELLEKYFARLGDTVTLNQQRISQVDWYESSMATANGENEKAKSYLPRTISEAFSLTLFQVIFV